MNILIVNHHGALGRLVGQLASQTGWVIKITSRILDLRVLLAKEKIDLIVCDATAAEEAEETIGRLEFIKVLRDAHVQTRVLLFEQEGTEVTVDPVEAEALGGVTVLRKPVAIADVRRFLAQTVDHIHNQALQSDQQRQLDL